MGYHCSICKEPISKNDFERSMTNIGAALCLNHQRVVTPQAIKLSKALKNLHIDHQLEFFDGFKHVDLAIPNAKMYIELDGTQHAFNPQQACIDDDRDQYSMRDGFITKRYPNSYIDSDVDSIALSIATVVYKRRNEFLNIKEKEGKKGIWKSLRDKVYSVSEKLENFE
jgi:very-short-patch-repair endonuclease